MKYVLIDQTDTDWFTDEFDDLDEAIAAGDSAFSLLTKIDKKRRTEFYLLESVNPDEDAENHLDGTVIKQWM